MAAEGEAAPREEEVMPEGTAEAETGGVVLGEGPALTNKTLRKRVARWCGGDREGLPHISTWNTSRVSDMSKLFENRRVFNDNIGTWDTSGVTSMEWMFMGASSFNQPIGNWRVDKVTNMSSMFHGAKSFNQPLNDWRVDNVTNMQGMFSCVHYDDAYGGYSVIRGSSFNQPLNDWRVDNVTNMSYMFSNAWAFNQPLNDWRVDNVTNMHGMFLCTGPRSFNQPLGNWRLRPDCDIRFMFGGGNFRNSRPVGGNPGGCCAIS